MKYFNSSLLLNIPFIEHAFFSHRGGVSSGIYESLNCGYGSQDNTQNVIANRTIVADFMGVPYKRLITCHQTHSDICVCVDDTVLNSSTPIIADALITQLENVAISVLTADCGSILLADTHNPIVAVIHSGWKGAHQNIISKVIQKMQKLGSHIDNIVGCLGPTISRESYEVDTRFYNDFYALTNGNTDFFSPGKDAEHWQFDLPQFIAHQAHTLGIRFENINLCTYKNDDLFFSRRRNFHSNISDYGRLISSIKIRSH